MKFLVLALFVAGATAAIFPQGKIAEPAPVKPSVEVEQPIKDEKPIVETEKIEEKVQEAVPQGRSFPGFSAPRYNYKNNNQQNRFKVQPNKPYIAIDPVPIRAVKPPTPPKSINVNYGPDQNAEVLRSVSDVNPEGFNYAYETANGISADAQGSLRTFANQQQGIAIQGSYRYTAPDGTPVVFTYIADENGYQPQSDLLPQAPPVPEAIARSLEYIARNAPSSEIHPHKGPTSYRV